MFLIYKDIKVLVSPEHHNLLKDYVININSDGFVNIYVNNKLWLIHKYIIIEILKKNINSDCIIKHINNNKLDNRIENLRIEKIKSYNNKLDNRIENLRIEKIKSYKKKKKNNLKSINKIENTIPLNGMKNHIDTADNLKNANITKKKHDLLLEEFKLKFNKIKNNDGNYIFIIKNKQVIIDKDTYILMYRYKWYIDNTVNQVKTTIKTKIILLSQMIMNCNEYVIDHINGNTLDNRRCNLRIISDAQNLLNKISPKNSLSKYIGVNWHKIKKMWEATIIIDSMPKHLGYFNRESDAALARDYATKQYYKDFGRLNFPERPGWKEYFMNLAEAVKLRSPDYYKVGGVLVSIKNNRIISTGYNSIASNLNDNINWSQRDFINDIVVHAEMNVLLYCESRFEDSILYITTSPCVSCLKMLSASKIKKIIYKHEYKDIDKVKKLAEFLQIELIEYENVR